MSVTASPRALRGRRVVAVLITVIQVALLMWSVLAVYWSNLPHAAARLLAAAVFLSAGVWLLLRPQSRRTQLWFFTAFALVLVWWLTIRPSHDRPWKRETAVLPNARVDGDEVTLKNVRNFHYRSVSDFDAQYEDRTVRLSQLSGVSFFFSKWSESPIAHTFVSFDFADAPPVCISIEARLEQGEAYSALASCFKQAELIYLVGTEEDIVGVRTHHRNERVWRYRTSASPQTARVFFLSYLEKINQLATEPEFYHLLSNNCTVNIDRHSSPDGRGSPFDIRLLVNGWADEYAYDKGLLDSSLPFAELKAQSEITALARAQPLDATLSPRIRGR
jgi:hypothetical protein